MVERGHDDGVGMDESNSFEYAKVRRFYDKMGIPDVHHGVLQWAAHDPWGGEPGSFSGANSSIRNDL